MVRRLRKRYCLAAHQTRRIAVNMKLFKIIFAFLALVVTGVFGYFAVIDIPVQQQEVVQTIPNERFFK